MTRVVNKQGEGRGACWTVGAIGHRRVECKYVLNGFKCHESGEAGDKAKVFPQRSKVASSFRNSGPTQKNNKVRRVIATEVDGYGVKNEATVNTVKVWPPREVTTCGVAYALRKIMSEEFSAKVIVNGVLVKIAIDTSAETSIVSSSVWHTLDDPTQSPAPTIRTNGGGVV